MTDSASSPSAGATEPDRRPTLVIGVISDTHDHLYPEIKELLNGVDHIIHAGDVCSASLLTELRAIAPLTAARGNCDAGAWANDLPSRAEVELAGVRVLVGHVGGRLREETIAQSPGVDAPDVVVFGHSHQPLIEERDGILFVNPGSAGPRRWGRPRTMAFLRVTPGEGNRSGGRSRDDHARGGASRVAAEIVVVEG